MRWILCFVILACAAPLEAAKIRFEISGTDARSHGIAPNFLDLQPYVIEAICEQDLSSCMLDFNVPGAPAAITLPTVEVVWNDQMHSTGTRGFTSADAETFMMLLGTEAELAVLDVNNFSQAVFAIDWRHYDLATWPNYTGYYGAVSQDISTPLIIPEPSFASMAWLPLTLGFGSIRSFARRRRGRHLN